MSKSFDKLVTPALVKIIWAVAICLGAFTVAICLYGAGSGSVSLLFGAVGFEPVSIGRFTGGLWSQAWPDVQHKFNKAPRRAPLLFGAPGRRLRCPGIIAR